MRINEILDYMDTSRLQEESQKSFGEILEEGAIRQVRRYGNKLKFQYRCQGGDKDGELVSKPSECAIRKNPEKVQAGINTARTKKGQRVRKTKFTKKTTLSQILVRKNKMLKGPTADKVIQNNPEIKSDNITTVGSKGTE